VLSGSARQCGGLQYYFGRISNLLVVVNSAANFPVYLFFNTRFRHVLGAMLGRAGAGAAEHRAEHVSEARVEEEVDGEVGGRVDDDEQVADAAKVVLQAATLPRAARQHTSSPAIAEGPRDASRQLKSCRLPRDSAETNRSYEVGRLQWDNVK